MRSKLFTFSIACGGAVLLAACHCAYGSGSVSGQGRFEKIAGNPAMGYKYLYEWDLFLSAGDNSMVGPARRLGAPPGQPPTGDGYYRIAGLPGSLGGP